MQACVLVCRSMTCSGSYTFVVARKTDMQQIDADSYILNDGAHGRPQARTWLLNTRMRSHTWCPISTRYMGDMSSSAMYLRYRRYRQCRWYSRCHVSNATHTARAKCAGRSRAQATHPLLPHQSDIKVMPHLDGMKLAWPSLNPSPSRLTRPAA